MIAGKKINETLGRPVEGLSDDAIFGRQTRIGDGYCGEVYAVIIEGVEKGSIDDDGNGFRYNEDINADAASYDLDYFFAHDIEEVEL